MTKLTNQQPTSKYSKEMEKKAATSEVEKKRRATAKKTESLRALRLAKEAEELAAKAAKPAKKKRAAKKAGLPDFEREV